MPAKSIIWVTSTWFTDTRAVTAAESARCGNLGVMMSQATDMVDIRVRFYAELGDFLPAARRGTEVQVPVARRTAVKDVIERLGIPHTEVALILVDGEPVGFGHQLVESGRVSVYPPFRTLDISGVPTVQPGDLTESRFVVDAHLGKLAFSLRLLGFDTVYRNDASDDWLARLSATEERVLLTRDRQLLKRTLVRHGYCVRSDAPRAQLVEVMERFRLADQSKPFTRCTRCNGPLHDVTKEEVLDRLEPLTRLHYDTFRQCGACEQVYWRGSHYEPLQATIQRALAGPYGPGQRHAPSTRSR